MTVININVQQKLNALYDLASSYGCEAVLGAELKNYVSFRTGGACDVLITPKSVDALKKVLCEIKKNEIPLTVLGNGSNVLVPDDGIRGAVIRIADGICDLCLVDETTIYCGAGTKLVTVCNFALQNSLSGIEFAYGIPGSVGGAAYMNAGAYGGEMKNIVTKVCHIDNNGIDGSLDAAEIGYGYRTSAYCKNGFIITGIFIKLQKGEKDAIKAKMDELLGKRKDKQPLEYPSAGSTFKRPDGYFAGALIEQCGLKGKKIGGAAVSEKHAGFVINEGNATSTDILMLIDYIKATVKAETGVTLEPEVKILR